MNDQLDLFSFSAPKYKITKPIRLIEMFAGIGSQYASLKRLGANVESWKCIEYDQHAIDSFNAIHGTHYVPSDIRAIHSSDLEIIEQDSYCYICSYSFPCQDLSNAGLKKGMRKGDNTRSGLLWEVERILEELHSEGKHIDVLLMENVPMVIGKKNIKDFTSWRSKLEQLGYSNFVQILNSKEIGYPQPIPQNRARCFMVSVYGDYHYDFPKKKQLTTRLKDFLEDKVDEKYFLSDAQIELIKYK